MNKTTAKPTWSSIKPRIVAMDQNAVIGLIKDLFDASSDNRAFLAARFLAEDDPNAALDVYRTKIWEQFYPKRGHGNPKASVCRKAMSDYRKARGDLRGMADLMLLYLEAGTAYTNDYGDIDEAYYYSLSSVLDELVKLLTTEEGAGVYSKLRPRFLKLASAAADIGWGYGDDVTGQIEELENWHSDEETSN